MLYGDEAICGMLAGLGYVTRPVETAEREGWALAPEVAGRLVWLGHAPDAPGFVVVLLRSAAPFVEGAATWLPRWAGRLWRRNRAFRGLLLVSDPAGSQLWAALPHPAGDPDAPGVHLIALRPDSPAALEEERLQRLRPLPGESAEGLTARLREELDLARVTRRFYLRFERCHHRLAAALEGWSGEVGDEARRQAALLLLNRLIFLYFLQKKRLLDGRPDFLRELVRRWRAASSPGQTFYRAVLRPLLFAALNRPPQERPEEVRALGALPYLNGGLFEPSALERRHPRLDVPDEALWPAFDHLLERFAFTTREDGEGIGIDPASLGRVFEALMEPEERAAAGVFYTPRALVEEVFRSGLLRQLVAWGVHEGAAAALLDPSAARPVLPRALGEAVQARLEHLSVLDLACGSGAFLLGALHQLEALHQRLRGALGQRPEPAASLRRRLVTRTLHGVDIQPVAAHLCALRLWLAILDVEAPGASLEPLPNLEHRIRCGDALRSPLGWLTPGAAWSAWQRDVEELDDLKQRYASASGGEKAGLRQVVAAAEGELLDRLLREHLRRLEARREALESSLATPPLLPGLERPAPAALRRELAALRAEQRRLRALAELPAQAAFSPDLHFPEVMQRGGFDLIVGNPPWVRLEHVPRATQEALRRRYVVLHRPAWTAGGLLESTPGGGTRVDLAACFVERAVELLRPGGTMALLLPTKLTRALYGGAFRRLVLQRTCLHEVRELSEDHFPGARAYPCALVATRAEGASAPPDLSLDPEDLAAPWVRTAPGALTLGQHPPLAAHPALSPTRGVMTGYNEAFVRQARRDAPAWEAALLRGADLGAFRYRVSHHLIYPHDPRTHAPLASLPAELLCELRPFRGRLERRADLGAQDPWWRLFRVGDQLAGPRVAWRDIGARLEAVALPERGDQGRLLLPLNTSYYIPTVTLEAATLLAAWLNSSPVRQLAAAIAEPAADGYRRFFSWVIAVLPLPAPLAEALSGGLLPPVLRRLLLLGQHLHLHPERADALQSTLDALVLALYERPAAAQPSLLRRSA